MMVMVPPGLLAGLGSLYLSRRAKGQRGGDTILHINTAGDWDRKF